MASFHGKVIAITGAASGMGLATAKLLAERGASLSLSDVQAELLDATATECRAANKDCQVITAVVDVADAKAVEAWIKKTVERFGKLDGAANIAGIFKANLKNNVAEEDEGTWDLLLAVNLTGVMHCMRSELKVMTSGASIVNAASVMGLEGGVGSAAYASSKHGLIGLTRSSAKEVGPSNIRVNCFCP